MSENKFNIYKPLCVVLAGATAFSLKGNFDNTKQISELKTDISALTEDYSELGIEYETLAEQPIKPETETIIQEEASSDYQHNVQPIYANGEEKSDLTRITNVYRVVGDTDVYHTDRNCYHIRGKDASELISIPLEKAEDSGLRKCSHCKPLY